MEKVKVWKILRKYPFNPRIRYSVIESEQGYYLIDHDRTLWRSVVPFLNWIIPEKAMRINLAKSEINDLLLHKRKSQKYKEDNALGTGIAVLITATLGPAFLYPIFDYLFDFNLPSFINYIIAFLIIIGVLIIKVRLSKSAKQIVEIIGEENLSKQKIRIFPASIFSAIISLASFLLMLFLASALFLFLGTEGNQMNIIILALSALGIFMLLNVNSYLMNATEYRIKVLD